MAPPLLLLKDIRVALGSAPLLTGAELAVSTGDRVVLVGRNGSGKSTLLKIAAGLIQPDAGTRFVQPGATIRYLPQEPDLTGFATVRAYVEAGIGPGDDPHRATYLMAELGLTGEEAPARLSGGEARRAALARTLAPMPDILLLDEPTNHLDLPAIEWLENELKSMRSGIVLISHDRRLLERLSQSIVWLDRGTTRGIDRGFTHFEAWRDEVLEQEERDRHKLGRKLAMEEDWLRYGVTARRKRNVKRLSDLHGLRKQRREQRGGTNVLRMAASDNEISGRLVVVTDHVSKSFDGRPIVADLTTRVLRGDRLGIVGPNGAGKTTLLGLLTGTLPPDSGEVKQGASLTTITLDQRRASLDPNQTLANAMTGGHGERVIIGGQSRHVVSYMKDFLFQPEQANTPVGVLSGGERGRLMLARALAQPANLLVLDEPTNDLDLETLDLLQELLGEYPGTVLVVSHDRDFLDRVATSVIAAEGDGKWVEYAGGYSDMLVQRDHGGNAPIQTAAKSKPQPQRAGAPSRSKRLTFKDKHALETLPARISGLSDNITRLGRTLADPDLYAKNPQRFQQTTAALEVAKQSLAETEEQWLTLEMMREEIEA